MSAWTERGSERVGSASEDPGDCEDPEDTKGAAGPPPRSSSARRQSKSPVLPVPSGVVEPVATGACGGVGAGGVVAAEGGGEG